VQGRGNSVSVVTRLRAGGLGFDFRKRLGVFLFATAYRPALGPTQPRIQWALSPTVKRPGREADHSPPSSAAVKNVWSCASISPSRLHGVVLNKTLHTSSLWVPPSLLSNG
jgi:hypothetical protein